MLLQILAIPTVDLQKRFRDLTSDGNFIVMIC